MSFPNYRSERSTKSSSHGLDHKCKFNGVNDFICRADLNRSDIAEDVVAMAT